MIITLIIPCTSTCKYVDGISEYDFRQVFDRLMDKLLLRKRAISENIINQLKKTLKSSFPVIAI